VPSPSRWIAVNVVPACIVLLTSLPARAQEPPPPDSSTPPAQEAPGAELTPEEMKEIEAALGQDKEAAPRTPAEAPAASGADAPLPVPQALSPSFLDLSLVLDFALAAFTAEEPLQTGGHDPNTNGFNFQQLELSIVSVVDPYFRFNANIVFALTGVEIEEAYVTTLDLPANLQVRAGQFLTRFGRQNSFHPHAWEFVDQPFALGRVFGAENNSGLGIELSWLTPLPWYVEVLGSATDASGEASARSFLGGGGGGVVSPLDFQFTGAVKQFFPLSDDLSLLWGLSTATGPNASGHRNYTNIFGTDVYLKYRPTTVASTTVLALQAELLYRRRQVPDDVLSDFNGYAQTSWRFSKRWATAARYEFGTPARDLDGRIAPDPLDPDWSEPRQRISANVTFWPTEFSRLRLQAATDRVGWRDEPDYSITLAFEAVMGAHGAHTF
jgi:hypothetical protein